MPRREAAEENAAEKRCAKGEEEDLEIEVWVGFIRDAELVSGHEAHYASEKGDREEGSEKAAHQCQGKTFDEELTEDASAGSALRGADGDFFLASGAPGEEKVGDVDAGDEENEADGPHHQPEAEAGWLGKKVVFERLDGDGQVGGFVFNDLVEPRGLDNQVQSRGASASDAARRAMLSDISDMGSSDD